MTQQESPQEPPKIEFPCANYPVKILGYTHDNYAEHVFDIVRRFDPECDFSKSQTRDSRNGLFRSITVYITATSIEQLHQLHEALKANEHVRMVI